MRFRDLFKITKYISVLEQNVLQLTSENEILSTSVDLYQEKTDVLEQKIVFLQGKMDMLDKYFLSTPDKNEIEEKGVEEIEIDENFRIPIVDGIKVKFEGEDDNLARSFNVYGPGQKPKKVN